MGAVTQWKERRGALMARLTEQNGLEKAQDAIKTTLEQVQHAVMSSEQDDVVRQQTGILFAETKDMCRMYTTLGEAKIWTEQALEKNAHKLHAVDLLLLLSALGCQAGAGYYFYAKELVWGTVLVGSAMVLTLALTIIRAIRKHRIKAKLAQPQQRVTEQIDVQKLLTLLDRHMEDLDRHIEELSYLSGIKNALPAHSENLDALKLCQALLEAQSTENDDAATHNTASVDAYLRSVDIEALPYSAETKTMFHTLPAKSGCITVKPALRSIKDGSVVLMGLAAVADELTKE